jgi:hypothetical protein
VLVLVTDPGRIIAYRRTEFQSRKPAAAQGLSAGAKRTTSRSRLLVQHQFEWRSPLQLHTAGNLFDRHLRARGENLRQVAVPFSSEMHNDL